LASIDLGYGASISSQPINALLLWHLAPERPQKRQ